MGLTPGALVFAIFCVLWTSATAFVAGAVGSLYLQTRRRLDFISLLSYVVVVAMLASVGQQIYTIVQWDKVKAQENQDSIKMAGKIHAFDIGSNKVVRAFYYTQMLCYTIAAGLIAFWCCFLWANVWLKRWSCCKGSRSLTIVKWSTITIACGLMGISHISYFSDKPIARFLVGNILFMIFLTATPIFLSLILYRYLHFRLITISSIRRQKSLDQKMQRVHSLPKEPLHGVTTKGSNETSEPIVELKSFPREREGCYTPTPQKGKVFGTLLMIRFAGAILVMSGLGIFNVCFQITQVMSFQSIKEIPSTTMAQINDTYLFLPATSQGWLILLVFGTTEGYWGRFKALLSWIFCLGCLHGPLFLENIQNEHDTRQDQLEGQPVDLDHYLCTLRKRDIEHSSKQLETEEAIDGHIDSATQGAHKNPDATRRRSEPYIFGHFNVTQPLPPEINRRNTTTLFESLSKPLPHPPSCSKAEYGSEPVYESTWELRSISYI